MLPSELIGPATRIGDLLRQRHETVVVAEGSAGGLISAALLAIPGASAYYLGGTVVYTRKASLAWMSGPIDVPPGMRGATEDFARYLARAAAARLGSTWGVGEAGAAGPPNPYGDPAGHTWLAIAGPAEATRNLLTGGHDRQANMIAFASAALELFEEVLRDQP